jgi:phosphoribosylformylglycinamidine cyclo-ligase
VIERDSWNVPPLFGWLQRLGEVDPAEMDRVFNMGVGLILVVSPYYADSIRTQLSDLGVENWTIGRIVDGPSGVVFE